MLYLFTIILLLKGVLFLLYRDSDIIKSENFCWLR